VDPLFRHGDHQFPILRGDRLRKDENFSKMVVEVTQLTDGSYHSESPVGLAHINGRFKDTETEWGLTSNVNLPLPNMGRLLDRRSFHLR
jgi:hypothetical protein